MTVLCSHFMMVGDAMRTLSRGLVCFVLLSTIFFSNFSVSSQSQRPFTVDDVLRLEEFGPVSVSSDGKWVAYVIKRPRLRDVPQRFGMNGYERADVWVAPVNGSARNLTRGAVDNAGFWAPTWSPDGKRLAMLSTRGGIVNLWVWNRDRNLLKRVSLDVVDCEFEGDSPIWVSNRRVFLPALPTGAKPQRMTIETRTANRLMHDWPRAWKGEITADTIEIGSLASQTAEQGTMLLVDVETGAKQSLSSGYMRQLRPSPNGQLIAYLKRAERIVPDSKRLPTSHIFGEAYYYRVEIINAAGEIVSGAAAQIRSVFPGSLTWTPRGDKLVFIGYEDRDRPPTVFRFDPFSRALEKLNTNGIDLPPPWTTGTGVPIRVSAGADVLVLTRPLPESESGSGAGRTHWWKLDPRSPPKDVASTNPSGLISDANANMLLGVSGGDIVQINLSDGSVENLTEKFEPSISSIVWPTRYLPRGSRRVVVRAPRDQASEYYELDLDTNQQHLIPKPSATATLLNFLPSDRTALFFVNDRSGTKFWVSNLASGQSHLLARTNTFLNGIAQGQFKRIEYQSLDKQRLNAWIVLPVGYQEGHRYPTVSWVYPGTVGGSQPPLLASLNLSHSLNLQLLASHGYAVLIPSMPTADSPTESEPMAELTNGVLPAIDKAIEVGIADPERLGLVGQSYGGYATYGLVTQTNRFKAAIALAGISDLVSLYGQFDPRARYDENAYERMFQMPITESGQNRMGVAPWKDPQKYIRNSPLFFVDRVQTPLMIIQGDADYVPMQQGEEFFAGLYRQNKRVAFVRYIGEGHLIRGPGNIRDMWQRVFRWFDEFLKP